MFFREVITLITETPTVNDYGDPIMTETSKTVYADKKSIRQSEFYQAYATGLKPEVTFTIRLIDYTNEEKLTHNSKSYNIIRTYDKDGEFIELICGGIVGTERGGK